MLCPICNSEFQSTKNSKTCSKICAEVRWKQLNYPRVKLRRKRLKTAAVAYKGGRCCNCNYVKCHDAMEFHHLDPAQKDFDISKSLNISWLKIKAELDKCILLCSNCHRESHAGLFDPLSLEQPLPDSSVEDPKIIDAGYKPHTCKCGSEIYRQSTRCASCARSQTAIMINTEELASLLWQEPVAHIAIRYDVSDSFLGSLVKKLGLSKPPVGYWNSNRKKVSV